MNHPEIFTLNLGVLSELDNSPGSIVISFWNIKSSGEPSGKGRNIPSILADFVHENQISILCLCESDLPTTSEFLKVYNSIHTTRKFELVDLNDCNISILSSLPKTCFKNVAPAIGTPRWLSYQISIPSVITFNLFTIHFQSKINAGLNPASLLNA